MAEFGKLAVSQNDIMPLAEGFDVAGESLVCFFEESWGEYAWSEKVREKVVYARRDVGGTIYAVNTRLQTQRARPVSEHS